MFEEKEFLSRHGKLMDFANELEEKIKEGIRGKVEDNGYFEKIAKKVVDNLQVKINNIHVRFEQHDKMRY